MSTKRILSQIIDLESVKDGNEITDLVKDKEIPLFTENSFCELAILSELENEEEFQNILRTIKRVVNVMFQEKASQTDYYDYVIMEQNLSDHTKDASVNLDLVVDDLEETLDLYETDDLYNITFEEYVKNIRFRILDEIDGNNDETTFEFTESGLLSAIQKFKQVELGVF